MPRKFLKRNKYKNLKGIKYIQKTNMFIYRLKSKQNKCKHEIKIKETSEKETIK